MCPFVEMVLGANILPKVYAPFSIKGLGYKCQSFKVNQKKLRNQISFIININKIDGANIKEIVFNFQNAPSFMQRRIFPS